SSSNASSHDACGSGFSPSPPVGLKADLQSLGRGAGGQLAITPDIVVVLVLERFDFAGFRDDGELELGELLVDRFELALLGDRERLPLLLQRDPLAFQLVAPLAHFVAAPA